MTSLSTKYTRGGACFRTERASTCARSAATEVAVTPALSKRKLVFLEHEQAAHNFIKNSCDFVVACGKQPGILCAKNACGFRYYVLRRLTRARFASRLLSRSLSLSLSLSFSVSVPLFTFTKNVFYLLATRGVCFRKARASTGAKRVRWMLLSRRHLVLSSLLQ